MFATQALLKPILPVAILLACFWWGFQLFQWNLVTAPPSSTRHPSNDHIPAAHPDRPLILYAYAESATARENLGFFLRKGLHAAADFVFIFNGETNASRLVPDAPNIEIVERSNTCFDLGAYGEVLRKDDLWTRYKRFVLLNASIRGPFLPTWSSSCWSDLFLDRLTAKKKLIGMTLNCQPRMHIQSMILATDKIGMHNLLDPALAASASVADQFGTADDPVGLSGCYSGWNAAVHAEVGTTSLITSAGYEVDALMTALHSERSAEEYCKAHPDSGDLLWDKRYFGGNIHPYETVFAKTNRNVDKEFMAALTEFHLRSEITSYTACGSAGYVVASRLSDADPSLSILVIGCGPDNRDDSTVVHPIFAFGRMATCGKTMLNYSSIKEPRTAERVINTVSAGLLGGGSAINMSTYQRPERFDYNCWKVPGWSANGCCHS
ncbi:Alcohol oxidase like protein [Verticillium longisporum]|nr:Alcohol oxidase like protein [Verticillium longisporum]